jgi:hypothetical protein
MERVPAGEPHRDRALACGLVGDEERREPQEGEPGGPPTLGNAVYRWADRILGPLPYGVRVTIVGAIILALVILPIVLFLILLSRA